MSRWRILQGLALDATLWYLAPALFLLAYILLYSGPTKAIGPHLLIAGLPLGCGILMRIMLARLIPSERLARFACALLLGGLLVATLTYYALLLIGLHSWAGIVAWSVIPTIFTQAPQLLDVLGVPQGAPLLLLILTYAGMIALCWLYLRRFDWVRPAVSRCSPVTGVVAVLGGAAIIVVEGYQFSTGLWRDAAEPVSLSAFPLEQELEGHAIDPLIAANVDRREELARRAYPPASQTARRRNVILIVVDALRPDHMGIFGYGRDTTPNLQQVRSTGNLQATIAHSSCADTICGLLSLASSKFPRGFSFRPFTLHEALRRNGYKVHLILSGDHSHFYSLKNYYGPVDSFYDGTHARGYFLNDDRLLLGRVAAMAAWNGQPTMFQFHVMSSHILRQREDQPGRFQPAKRYLLNTGHDLGAVLVRDDSAINFYDNGVLNTDEVIHELIQVLDRKGYLRDALVVITADHGESLGEHGLFQHANSVREEVLRVPLILITYGYPPRGDIGTRKFASQVDIAPTILWELGLPCPVTWAGRPLQLPETMEFTYFEEHHDVGLIDARLPASIWKYWANLGSGEQHVFDLRVDPHEQRDLASSTPNAQLNAWRARAMSGTPSKPPTD